MGVYNVQEFYREFLQAVANGDERSHQTWRRNDFKEKYHSYFPANVSATLGKQLHEYEEVQRRWIGSRKEIPKEEPDSEYGYHVVILRRQLRVIWDFADSGDLDKASEKCYQLYTDAHRYLRSSSKEDASEPWRHQLKSLGATELKGLLPNLKLCENPNCDREPYFIRHGRRRYCSIPCSAEEKAARNRERKKDKPKTSKNENMSKSATKRWRREKEKREALRRSKR